MKSYSFPKSEHLYGEKKIGRLFAEGSSFVVYPLRVVFLQVGGEDGVPVKVMVSVPKKRFKRAVKRNRLKRLMRESYRLNKHLLTEHCVQSGMQLNISFQYISDEELDFDYIEKRMKKALGILIEKNNTDV